MCTITIALLEDDVMVEILELQLDRTNSTNSDLSHIKKKSKGASSTSSLGSSIVVLSEPEDDLENSLNVIPNLEDCISRSGEHSAHHLRSEAGGSDVVIQSYQMVGSPEGTVDGESVITSMYDVEAWINDQGRGVRSRAMSSPELTRCDSPSGSLIHVPSVSQLSQDDQSLPEMGVSTLSLIVERLLIKIMDLEDSYKEFKIWSNEISDENKVIREKVSVLEVDRDDQLQWNISNRILIFNVPTKFRVSELKQLMIKLARKINIVLNLNQINDAYYLFKNPSSTSPVVIVFVNNALEKRYQILDRKHLLHNISMRSLGFSRGGMVYVDEQLIRSRNELKQSARRLKSQGLVMDSWVRDGNVWVRDVCGDVRKVVSQECLQSFW